MKYISTRSPNIKVSCSEAIRLGIAPDGGLFVPEYIPELSKNDLLNLYDKNYQQIAYSILEKFLTDFTQTELKDCLDKAYNSYTFDTPLICPLHPLNDFTSLLELWHGPTCAFKDLALQLLPHLLTTALKKLKDTSTLVILVATSGDTGKAALEGFKDIPGIKIIVFYPEDGVSQIQKLQMITQEGNNVAVVGVKGNFDDAQTGVKNVFGNKSFISLLNKKGYKLNSANSINWGRLVPQIVYYFSSYIYLLLSSQIKLGDKINICVPTGNFGNIMAAYYAQRMGLPVNKLIIANNENNVLTHFFKTGIYNANRELKTTISPSMDILISSNLERLLFEISNHDSEKISNFMKKLKLQGQYKIDDDLLKKIKNLFYADFATEKNTLQTIKNIFNEYKYIIDPHTAVALYVHQTYTKKSGDLTKTIIASTASPYKFNHAVMQALIGSEYINGKTEFELLNLLSATTKTLIPKPLKELSQKPILHTMTCKKEEIQKTVADILNIKL